MQDPSSVLSPREVINREDEDMYVAAAGINPQRDLPIMLDVGTNNEKLLQNPLYLGLRQPMLEGEDYLEIIDEFMEAAFTRWPKAVVQFEDFQAKWAFETLERYRKKFCMFNDDVQGTAGVALAGLLGTVRAQGRPLSDFVNQKIVVVGAGSAGLGVTKMAVQAVARMAGISEIAATKNFYLIDKDRSGRAGSTRHGQCFRPPKAVGSIPPLVSYSLEKRNSPWRALGFRTIHSSQPVFAPSDSDPGFKEEFEVGSKMITLETGKIALFAKGSAVISIDNTKVLSTIASHMSTVPNLHVSYEEKSFTQGLISNSDRRGTFSPKELLCGKLIEKSIKPLIPSASISKVSSCVLSIDGKIDPDIMAINATSAAIMISGLQWEGPIGAVRIGRIFGKLIVNPSMDQLRLSDLNLTYVCTRNQVLVIDVQATEISEEDMKAAIKQANLEALNYIEPQIRLARKVRKPKDTYPLSQISRETTTIITDLVVSRYSNFTENIYDNVELWKATNDMKKYVRNTFGRNGEMKNYDEAVNFAIKTTMLSDMMLRRLRVDKRQLNEVRHICFDRFGTRFISHGKTQEARYIVRHGDARDAQSLVSPFSPPIKLLIFQHDCQSTTGALVEKALQAVLPSEDDFRYPIYINSKVNLADGSNSMASVCGSSMALVDAKVSLRDLVAGVSIGLFIDDLENGTINYRIITDMLDIECEVGDMDFMIAGTRNGITAMQLDVKLTGIFIQKKKLAGIPLNIILESLEHGRQARLQIIDNMEQEMIETTI